LNIKKELKREINEWLGTPYKYGGNDKKGVDCSGFVQQVYKKVYHLNLPRTSSDIYSFCKKIKLPDLREGDLVFFDYEGKGVSHVGIYLSDNKFVHASSSKGVVISDLTNSYNKKKFVGAGRVLK
jgi:Cell wall-associated hydrolases (invasion-associated proteins)